MAGHAEIEIEIWNLGTLVTHKQSTINFVVLNAILVSFSALVSKWAGTQKQLAVE